jgi:AraC-like DNA-binding protein
MPFVRLHVCSSPTTIRRTLGEVRWYDPIQPRSALGHVLACSWSARPTGRHRLVPDACLDLLWLSTGEVWLCGPDTAAWTFELPVGVEAVGVRFRPGVAPSLWGFDASSLLDLRVPWRHVVGEAAERALAVDIALHRCDTDRIAVLEDSVAARTMAVDSQAIDDVANAVLQRIAADPYVRASDVGAECGLTSRHLLRRCQVAFGYGVSTLSRIVRFHRFWSIVEQSPAGASLATLAHEAGYSDQAHLTRDCRAIAGTTPRRFITESQSTFPDMSDPFKTGVPLAGRVRP